jgi:hypothetical protein
MKLLLTLVLLLGTAVCLQAFSATLRNEIAATGIVYWEDPEDNLDLSIMYQPEINASHTFGGGFSVSGQAMGNALIRQVFRSGDDYFVQRGKLYRLWAKAGTPQLEARVGLQRLNFGSAQLLRPLQWFDNLDPKDPLEQTEGVQAALLRYYFLNNANLWLWGIRGEGKPHGQMYTYTKEDTPELGGRFQYPLSKGEVALTFNHRFETGLLDFDSGSETRLGLDAKYDLGVGVWVEGFISVTEDNEISPPIFKGMWTVLNKYQAPVTVGMDYTFTLGNGIYALAEAQLWAEAESELTELSKEYLTYAFTANYPLGLLDTFYYYGTIRDDKSVSLHTLVWRRSYDRLSWDAAVFWDAVKQFKSSKSRGVKLLISYTF